MVTNIKALVSGQKAKVEEPLAYETTLTAFGKLLKQCDDEFRILAREAECGQPGGIARNSENTPEQYDFRTGAPSRAACEALITILTKAAELGLRRGEFNRLLMGYFADPEDQQQAYDNGDLSADELARKYLTRHQLLGKTGTVGNALFGASAVFLGMTIDNSAPIKDYLTLLTFGAMAGGVIAHQEKRFTLKRWSTPDMQQASVMISAIGTAAAQMGFVDRNKTINAIVETVTQALRFEMVKQVVEQVKDPQHRSRLCRDDIRLTLDYLETGAGSNDEERELIRNIKSTAVDELLQNQLNHCGTICSGSPSRRASWRGVVDAGINNSRSF